MSEAVAKSDQPLYQRIKEHIKREIRSGTWQEGSRVPSESALMAEFEASRMTVNRAVRELSAEGWLERVQGAGTFVAGQKLHSVLLEIRSIHDEIAERGGKHESHVLRLLSLPAEPWMARALEVAPGSPVFHSAIVHLENGQPIQFDIRYVNPAFAPGYLEQDFTRQTPFDYLIGLGPIEAAEHRIEAIMPDEEMRRALKLDRGEPCLSLIRRTWSGGVVVTRSRQLHPGSHFAFIGRQDYRSAAS